MPTPEEIRQQFLAALDDAAEVKVYFCPIFVSKDFTPPRELVRSYAGIRNGFDSLSAALSQLASSTNVDRDVLHSHFELPLKKPSGYRVGFVNDLPLNWPAIRIQAVGEPTFSYGLWLDKPESLNLEDPRLPVTESSREANVVLTFRGSRDGWHTLLRYLRVFAHHMRQSAILMLLPKDDAWAVRFPSVDQAPPLPNELSLGGPKNGERRLPPDWNETLIDHFGTMHTWEVSSQESWTELMKCLVFNLNRERPETSNVYRLVRDELMAAAAGRGATFERHATNSNVLVVKIAGEARFLFAPSLWHAGNADPAGTRLCPMFHESPHANADLDPADETRIRFLTPREGKGRGAILDSGDPRSAPRWPWPPEPSLTPTDVQDFFDRQ